MVVIAEVFTFLQLNMTMARALYKVDRFISEASLFSCGYASLPTSMTFRVNFAHLSF